MKSEAVMNRLPAAQQNEIDEHRTYAWLAENIKDEKNRKILGRIAREALAHCEVIRRITQTGVKPQKFRVLRYQRISRVLGLSFGLRLMGRGEAVAKGLRLRRRFAETAAIWLGVAGVSFLIGLAARALLGVEV